MKTIAVFGDSIAYGLNAEENRGWVALLAEHLSTEGKYSVRNLAVRGETTEMLLQHLHTDCEKEKPAVLIVAVGINDSLYSFTEHRPKVRREKFEENLGKIVAEASQFSAKLVFVGINRVDERRSVISLSGGEVCQYQNITIQKYNDSFKSTATSLGAAYIDLYSILSDEELDDGYHPTTAGHKKLFQEIEKSLLPILADER